MLGPKNPAVQELRRLLSSRRHRREVGRFAIEGPELLAAALAAGWTVDEVFVDPSRPEATGLQSALDAARQAGCPLSELAPGVLDRVADAQAPQPCVAIVRGTPPLLDPTWRPRFVLVADRIQDPGNLGALVRVAEAAEADGVVLTGASADPLGPKALRGSAGSAFRVMIAEHANALEALEMLRAAGLTSVVSSPSRGVDFAELDWPARTALVVGNEAQGLDPSVLAAGEVAVRIPMAPAVESLNLAVAAGILSMGLRRGLRAQVSAPALSSIAAMELPEH